MITDKPQGWIELVRSLMRVVPVEHPMGPSVIALLLDDSPLPSKDSVLKVADMITHSLRRNQRKERNLCVILGCLAEKLAGPSSIALLNDSTLKYLINNLQDDVDVNVKLLSLIALEKFAQTSENKATIKVRFLVICYLYNVFRIPQLFLLQRIHLNLIIFCCHTRFK